MVALVCEQWICRPSFCQELNNSVVGQRSLFRPLPVKGNGTFSSLQNRMLAFLFHFVGGRGVSAGWHKTYPKWFQITNKQCVKKWVKTMIFWARKLWAPKLCCVVPEQPKMDPPLPLNWPQRSYSGMVCIVCVWQCLILMTVEQWSEPWTLEQR